MRGARSQWHKDDLLESLRCSWHKDPDFQPIWSELLFSLQCLYSAELEFVKKRSARVPFAFRSASFSRSLWDLLFSVFLGLRRRFRRPTQAFPQVLFLRSLLWSRKGRTGRENGEEKRSEKDRQRLFMAILWSNSECFLIFFGASTGVSCFPFVFKSLLSFNHKHLACQALEDDKTSLRLRRRVASCWASSTLAASLEVTWWVMVRFC